MSINFDTLQYGQFGNTEMADLTQIDPSLTTRAFPILLITGPSGVGKGSVIEGILQRNDFNAVRIKRHTTKNFVGNEKDSYHFIQKDSFVEMIQSGEFLEWGFYGPGFYGTSVHSVNGINSHTGPAVVDVDLDSALVLKEIFTQCNVPHIDIFITPDAPTFLDSAEGIDHYLTILKRRISNRGRGEGNGEIRGRMIRAKEMIQRHNEISYIIPNYEEQLSLTIDTIMNLVKRTSRLEV